MTDKYTGTKFETIYIQKKLPSDIRIKRMIFWGKKLSYLGLTPNYDFGAAGNLSARTKTGFIITAAGKDLGNLEEADFIEIIDCDTQKAKVKVEGKKEPSSETLLHHEIYQKRQDINVIFHVHDKYAIENCDELGLICTKEEKPYGTRELVKEVLEVLDANDYIVMKNHGILSLASTTEEAGEKITEVNDHIKNLTE